MCFSIHSGKGPSGSLVPAQPAAPLAPELLVLRRAAAFRAGRGRGGDIVVSALPHAADRRGVLGQIEETPVGRPIVADAPARMEVSAVRPVTAFVSRNAAAPQAVARIERLEGAGLQGELEAPRPVELQRLVDEPGAKDHRPALAIDRRGRQGVVVVHALVRRAGETNAAIVVADPAKRRHVALPLAHGEGKALGVPQTALRRVEEARTLLPVLPHPFHGGFHERGGGPAQRQLQVALAVSTGPACRRKLDGEPIEAVVIELARHVHLQPGAGERLPIGNHSPSPGLQRRLAADQVRRPAFRRRPLRRPSPSTWPARRAFSPGSHQTFQKAARAVRIDSSHAGDGFPAIDRRREGGGNHVRRRRPSGPSRKALPSA